MLMYSKAGTVAACAASLPSNTSPHTLTQLGPVVSVSPVSAVVKWWYCMFCLCRYVFHSKLNPGNEVRRTNRYQLFVGNFTVQEDRGGTRIPQQKGALTNDPQL
jgi:hypothetical protein